MNGDSVPDIVSGEFWYQGPDFRRKHRLCSLPPVGDYYDDFSTIPMDVDGDGKMDFITGGYFGASLFWRENPGVPGVQWKTHLLVETGHIETTRAWDVDGDGELEIVPNTPQGPLVVYKLVRDAQGRGTGEFRVHKLKFRGRENDAQKHGLGFGDVNGDGRGDFVLRGSWLAAPAYDPYKGEWTWYPEYEMPWWGTSIPILVADVDGDGRAELIAGNGHGYGLSWWSQTPRSDGTRQWTEHAIDPFSSQYHDLQWVDLDGDGQGELVTGKRFRSHPHHEAGVNEAYGWYIFKWTGESCAKHVVDIGPLRQGKGLGIAFAVADLTGSGKLDVVAPGKDGLAVYIHQGDGFEEVPSSKPED